MRYGRIDQNQSQIVDALRAVGVSVQSMANIGHGCPDLLCAKGDMTWVIEVKGAKGKLTPDQIKFIDAWRGTVHLVRSIDDALQLVGVVTA